MRRAQYNECDEDDYLAKTVDLSKRTVSERRLVSTLLEYLSEHFRGAYYTEEVEVGEGDLHFGAEGLAYGLRYLFRASAPHGSIGISYHSSPDAVLCAALPADVVLTDDIKREIRTVAAYSDISFYGVGDNRFCFRFESAEKLHISVYAPGEDVLLAAFTRMLASVAPKNKENEEKK